MCVCVGGGGSNAREAHEKFEPSPLFCADKLHLYGPDS